jgi:hypothetical protein
MTLVQQILTWALSKAILKLMQSKSKPISPDTIQCRAAVPSSVKISQVFRALLTKITDGFKPFF